MLENGHKPWTRETLATRYIERKRTNQKTQHRKLEMSNANPTKTIGVNSGASELMRMLPILIIYFI